MIHPNSGATEGERSNARSILARMKPEPEKRRDWRASGQPNPYMRGSPDASSFGSRSKTYETNFADFYRMRAEEEELRRTQQDIMRRAREDLAKMSDQALWETLSRMAQSLGTNLGGDGNTDPGVYPKTVMECAKFGHSWVVIGTSMFHTDIKRCTGCGEFDPARRKK